MYAQTYSYRSIFNHQLCFWNLAHLDVECRETLAYDSSSDSSSRLCWDDKKSLVLDSSPNTRSGIPYSCSWIIYLPEAKIWKSTGAQIEGPPLNVFSSSSLFDTDRTLNLLQWQGMPSQIRESCFGKWAVISCSACQKVSDTALRILWNIHNCNLLRYQ